MTLLIRAAATIGVLTAITFVGVVSGETAPELVSWHQGAAPQSYAAPGTGLSSADTEWDEPHEGVGSDEAEPNEDEVDENEVDENEPNSPYEGPMRGY